MFRRRWQFTPDDMHRLACRSDLAFHGKSAVDTLGCEHRLTLALTPGLKETLDGSVAYSCSMNYARCPTHMYELRSMREHLIKLDRQD